MSSKVLDQSDLGDYNASSAPQIIIGGNLSIEPHSSLSGVAVLMPDGAVSTMSSTARVQIYGDVVAHDVQLTLAGTLAGNVSAVQAELAAGWVDCMHRLFRDLMAQILTPGPTDRIFFRSLAKLLPPIRFTR